MTVLLASFDPRGVPDGALAISGNVANNVQSAGESFKPSSTAVINNVQFYLTQQGAPTGNAVCRIYAATGVFGTTSKPTGSALASSDAFNVATVPPTVFTLTPFNFSGANKISLTSGTVYVAQLEYLGGNDTNNIGLGAENTSVDPNGNGSLSNTNPPSTWLAEDTFDFYVYGDAPGPQVTVSDTTTMSESVSLSVINPTLSVISGNKWGVKIIG